MRMMMMMMMIMQQTLKRYTKNTLSVVTQFKTVWMSSRGMTKPLGPTQTKVSITKAN